MEFALAAAVGVAAVAGIAGYLVMRRARAAKPPAAEFVCRRCGEKHCECESEL